MRDSRISEILRQKRLREQRGFATVLRKLRWEYFRRYAEFLAEKKLDVSDFSFYEFLLLEEKRENGEG